MSKLFSTVFRQKAELEDGKLVKDYFSEYRERNFMLVNILTFNNTPIPCYIKREDYRNNIKNFNIYSVYTDEIVPKESFNRFFILPKDNKVIDIPKSEQIFKKYKGKTYYYISEFVTFGEMFNKEMYNTFIINDTVCNLVSIKHSGTVFVFDFFDLSKGKIITIDSNNTHIQQIIVNSLSNKKCINKQQYVMILANILMSRIHKDDISKWSAEDVFINSLYRAKIDSYDSFRDYLSNLIQAK